jgi:response regulator RpfG family c-di-GMP phosphodiesterase
MLTPPTFSVVLLSAFHDEREMFAECLEVAGFHVRAFDDNDIAFQALLDEPPHAVVVRVRELVQGTSMLRFIAQVKGAEATRHVRLIVITTDGYSAADEDTPFGCDRVVLLPILPDTLAEVILDVMKMV